MFWGRYLFTTHTLSLSRSSVVVLGRRRGGFESNPHKTESSSPIPASLQRQGTGIRVSTFTTTPSPRTSTHHPL
jgi:hypothetical protein